METLSFARTKIQPPRTRTALVARARIDARLTQALGESRVVLIVAPAGFGKTSALAQQLARLPAGTAQAWIALDEDDDARRMFACLAAALEPQDLPWRTAPEALVAAVASGQAELRQAAAELLNALAAAEAAHGIIVFDDLHRVQDPAAFALIDALIERLPPRWTLVLASRGEPPLALARLRASGELAAFDQDDLRFGYGEVAALVASEASPELDERVAELYERTEGWPAGLRLGLAALRARPTAAIAGPSRQPSAIDRHLYDFLAAEVIDDMPPALRDFLLRCSVLPELTAARAAAVSGDARAARWLDQIERRGLFAQVLDTEERTLVLHDLFRDCLDDLLRRRLPDELPQLLQRAAAGETDPLRRVGYLLRAGDWAAAERALDGTASELFTQGASGEVLRLVGQFPPAWREASPRLLRLRGLAAWVRWQWSEMLEAMQAAGAAARAAGDEDGVALARAYEAAALNALGRNEACQQHLDALQGRPLQPEAEICVLMCVCAQYYDRGDHAQVAPVYRQLVERLEQIDDPLLWWECAPESTYGTLPGMKPVLARFFAGALRACGDRAIPLRGLVYIHRAYWYLWAGEPEEALAQAELAESDYHWMGCPRDIETYLGIFRALADALAGRAAAMHRALEALYAREDGTSGDRQQVWRNQMAFVALRLVDALGDAGDGLRRWASRIRDRTAGGAYEIHGHRALTLPARLAAAGGRWAEAAECFEAVLPMADRIDTMGQAVELRLRAAHAFVRTGRTDAAASVLRPALLRMREESLPGLALMAGPRVLAQLATQDWAGLLDPGEHEQLRSFVALTARWRRHSGAAVVTAGSPGTPVLPALPATTPAVPLDRPTAGSAAAAGAELRAMGLTQREFEVLERIAAGDSNKLIARAFDLSPHTVKRHVANILNKLGAASRGQAAAAFRRLG